MLVAPGLLEVGGQRATEEVIESQEAGGGVSPTRTREASPAEGSAGTLLLQDREASAWESYQQKEKS